MTFFLEHIACGIDIHVELQGASAVWTIVNRIFKGLSAFNGYMGQDIESEYFHMFLIGKSCVNLSQIL